jgi:glycosyltransferase EpsF
MEPIRVLQIIGSVESGGVEAVIMNYYRNIDRTRVQFDFVVHKNGRRSYIDAIKQMGARVYEITPYSQNLFAFMSEIYKIVKENSYKIVHCNMNAMSVFPLLAAKLGGGYVRILHNHSTDTWSEPLRTLVKRVLRPFCPLFANKYWACSRLAAVWMYGAQAVQDGGVRVITNAIALERFAFDAEKRQRLRKEFGVEDRLVLGHVGRMVKQKNPLFLLEVFSEVARLRPDAVLMMIGCGPLRKQIEQRIAELGLAGKVILTGARDDVADLYNLMDLFVFPSLYEGLSVVLLEAQSNGLGVITSDSITRESDLTDGFELLPLSLGARRWAERVVERADEGRNSENIKRVANAGYDIRRSAQELTELYWEMAREQKS